MHISVDIIIIGGGPAGLSAAMTARNRDKSVLIVSNAHEGSGLYKAKKIDNYPGMPEVTGPEMLKIMQKQTLDMGVQFVTSRIINAMPVGNGFFVTSGPEFYECKTLIIASGIVQSRTYPGENEFLGKGVSYCATCDGMLYKGKKVAVIGLSAEAEHDVEFLRSINCDVLYYNKPQMFEIKGDQKVEALLVGGTEYPVEGVFILRSTLAMSSLMPGIEMEDGHIKVNRNMSTSIPGVFAAGDCVGKPYQIPKAVGEGNIAALSAISWLDKK